MEEDQCNKLWPQVSQLLLLCAECCIACTVPISFAKMTCGFKCSLMWVIETFEKELGIVQQHPYWQPQLRSDGLTKNLKSVRVKVGQLLICFVQRKGRIQDCV